MITYSGSFVKSVIARDIMLNVNPSRPALPADLHLTKCPNRRLLRLPSADAGSPRAAGYSERRAWVGCGKCDVCASERVAGRIIKWSGRLKALLHYEEEVRESVSRFISFTYPRHPDGIGNAKGPTPDMLQDSWSLYRRRLQHWYKRRGSNSSDACNWVGFVEHGSVGGRLHLHLIFCMRPGFDHPCEFDQSGNLVGELLPTRDKRGRRIVLCGLGSLWRDVLESRGYSELLNWFNGPIASPGQVASYVTSEYLTKGFKTDEVYRVRCAQQDPKWPVLTEWYRDKMYDLQGESYRRWIGFRVEFTEVNLSNIAGISKRLAVEYARVYRESVFPSGRDRLRAQKREVDLDSLARAIKGCLADMASASTDRRATFGEDWGLPISLHLKPVMVALSDRAVRHPARADYLSVASFYEDGSFSEVSSISAPDAFRDERFNLCGASHWFPMDDNRVAVAGTEAFESLVGWNASLVNKLNKNLVNTLSKVLPGNAWSFVSQGMPAPAGIIDKDRVRRVASGFHEVFPDTSVRAISTPVSSDRELRVHPVQMGVVSEEVVSALDSCANWSELTDIRVNETSVPGVWPSFPLKVGQVKGINLVQSGVSAIYNLPTGYGKSLMYQLPNVSHGCTLVVSPLLSLMRDQVNRLTRYGVNATYIGGNHNKAAKVYRLESLGVVNYAFDVSRPDHYGLVYCAPESITGDGFLAGWLRDGYLAVSHLVVDEAHCVSQWSTFRPAYRILPDSLQDWYYAPRVLSLFSATISPRILSDLRAGFGADLGFFALPMVRANLHLRRSPVGFYDFFASEFLNLRSPVLVYAGQRARTEELSAFLSEQGVNAEFYHAGLDNSEREDIERRYLRGDIDVLVATVAFGLGVDKRDIRTIIHDSLPDTIEDYAQQVGRAGRDGLASECILLNNPGMVHNADMSAFFSTDGCLWQFVARYHGQPASACGHCDSCCGIRSFQFR